MKPYSSSTCLERSSSRDFLGVLPTSFACRMKDLFSDLAPKRFVFRIQDYCDNVLKRTVARVLPAVLINDVSLELDVLAVFRLSFGMFLYFINVVLRYRMYHMESSETRKIAIY